MNLEDARERGGDSLEENLNLSAVSCDFNEEPNEYLKENNSTEFGMLRAKSRNKMSLELGSESNYGECFSSNNFATQYECECPVNYSLKYPETEPCKNVSQSEVKKKEFKEYPDYTGTDLDQPTNFSLKYAEKTYDEENKNGSFKYFNNDEVKGFADYVEIDLDHPTDFTLKYRESVEEDVRNLEYNYYENEESNAPQGFDVQTVAEDASSERVPERYVFRNETPLMFSRSSSMNSLSSFAHIIQSIPDDRSSIVSDFSRMTSGIISPSELPDSPFQTAPSSPKRQKPSAVFFASVKHPKKSVFEDDLATFVQEDSPVGFSRASSLSSLITDHSLKSEIGIKRNTSWTVSEEENQDRAVDHMQSETLKQPLAPEKSEHEKGKFELASVLEVDESLFADCIRRESRINCRKPKSSFNRPVISEENNPQPRPTIGSPMKPNFRPKLHTESRKGYSAYEGSDDIVHFYNTEGTPANVSHAGSQSDLSASSISSGIPVLGIDDNSDNESLCPEDAENIPVAEIKALKNIAKVFNLGECMKMNLSKGADRNVYVNSQSGLNYLKKDHGEMDTFAKENFSMGSSPGSLTENVMDAPMSINRAESCDEPPSQMLSPLRNVSPQSPNSIIFEESDEAEKCSEEQQSVYVLSESMNERNYDWTKTRKSEEKAEYNSLNKDTGCSKLRSEPVNSTAFDFDANRPLSPYEEAILKECIRMGTPQNKNKNQLPETQLKLGVRAKCSEESQSVYVLSESMNETNYGWNRMRKSEEKTEKNSINKDTGCSELRTEPVNSIDFDFDANRPLTPYEEALLKECIRMGMPQNKNKKQLPETQLKLGVRDKGLEKRERDECGFSTFTSDKMKYSNGKKTSSSSRMSGSDTSIGLGAVNEDFDSNVPLTPFEEALVQQCIRLGMPQKKNCKKFKKTQSNYLDGGMESHESVSTGQLSPYETALLEQCIRLGMPQRRGQRKGEGNALTDESHKSLSCLTSHMGRLKLNSENEKDRDALKKCEQCWCGQRHGSKRKNMNCKKSKNRSDHFKMESCPV